MCKIIEKSLKKSLCNSKRVVHLTQETNKKTNFKSNIMKTSTLNNVIFWGIIVIVIVAIVAATPSQYR